MRVVNVVDECVQRPDPLGESALDRCPLGGGQDARHEVEGERAVPAMPVIAWHLERDPLVHEDRVAKPARRLDPLGSEPVERRDQRLGVRQRAAGRIDELIAAAWRDPIAIDWTRINLAYLQPSTSSMVPVARARPIGPS